MIKNLLAALIVFGIASTANSGDEEESCRTEMGAEAAATLVRQCIDISPATHPPCNDLNPCALIKDEIIRGCEFAKSSSGSDVPEYCN